MKKWMKWTLLAIPVLAAGIAGITMRLAQVQAAGPDPKALLAVPPDQIKWTGEGNSSRQAILYGDPSKPGLYIVLTKWLPGNMSRPHFHPNDRFVTVISGTWWVGTGPKYD